MKLQMRSDREPTPSISDLLDLAIAGDDRAFATIYNRHASKVFGLLTRLVGPISEREDLLQDVFIRLHKALPKYRRDATLATFLHRIAVRVAYDHLRKCKRQPTLAAGSVREYIDENFAAINRTAEREEVGEVFALLAQLKPKQRIALILRVALELSYPEIADLLGCRPATARMRVSAANRELEKLTARKRRSS